MEAGSIPAEAGAKPFDVYLTADVEPDCPPYLHTWRGIAEGMPELLAVCADERVPLTCFVTGETAELFPRAVEAIVDHGHEIGCHGYSHRSFADFDDETARMEIGRTNGLLRRFAPVTSFRAPYLRLPEQFLHLLAEDGITIDSSRARYKVQQRPNPHVAGVARLAASITSSALRLPPVIRDPWLRALGSPVVLFVHPWEFVDLSRTSIRWDCRFRTGAPALNDLRDVIGLFRRAGARFRVVSDYRATGRPA